MELILGILAGLFAAAAVWLALGRGRLQADAAAARAERDAAIGERDRIRSEHEAQASVLRDLHSHCNTLETQLATLNANYEAQTTAHAAELQSAHELHAERVRALEARERQLKQDFVTRDAEIKEHFKALAADALKGSNDAFLTLAKQTFEQHQQTATAELDKRKTAVDELVRPLRETLTKTEERLLGLAETSGALKSETARLVHALSKPDVRGRYGEIQLRRVLEVAGMREYCDYQEQASTVDDSGRPLRPDMIVKLPNDRVIVVDAKTNTLAYVEAVHATTPEEREACLERFASHVAEQVAALSKKSYWSEFNGSPDFVVMFIPGDQFLDAALARRTDLIEKAAAQNIILASPSTLIGLLRAVAVGWREKGLEDQARELFELGKQLHDRAATAFGHVASVGQAIDQAGKRYNVMVGSIESRLLPTLRRFEDSGARSAKTLPALPQVDVQLKGLPNEAPEIADA